MWYCTAENFHWIKILPIQLYIYICITTFEISSEINLRPCGKGHHRLNIIGQTNHRVKISTMRAGGKQAKNFSRQKFLAIYNYFMNLHAMI